MKFFQVSTLLSFSAFVFQGADVVRAEITPEDKEHLAQEVKNALGGGGRERRLLNVDLGAVCDVVVTPGTTPCSSGEENVYTINLLVGTQYTIEVDRVSCGMDPILALFKPDGSFLGSADDNDPDATLPGCDGPFSDPKYVFTPGVTGAYKLHVRSFVSACAYSLEPLQYNVVINPPPGCNEAPVAVCQDITVSLDDNCFAAIDAAALDGGSTDADGDALTFSASQITFSGTSSTPVTLTVSDGTVTSTCVATVNVIDDTYPVAVCVEGVNPSGHVPSSDNPDGFWLISATDNCGVTLDVIDSGSGHTYEGPFAATGTSIKYVQAPGAPVKERRGRGEVDWHLTGNGDMRLSANDPSGHIHTVDCLVPPNRLLRARQ